MGMACMAPLFLTFQSLGSVSVEARRIVPPYLPPLRGAIRGTSGMRSSMGGSLPCATCSSTPGASSNLLGGATSTTTVSLTTFSFSTTVVTSFSTTVVTSFSTTCGVPSTTTVSLTITVLGWHAATATPATPKAEMCMNSRREIGFISSASS